MGGFIDSTDWRRVWKIVVQPALFYVFLAAVTRADKLNPVLLLVLISMSVAVWIAFLPNLIRAFRKDQPLDTEALVCIGVSVAWLSNLYRPAIALAILMFPTLAWIRESDFVSVGLYAAIYAAVMHLIAPAVDNGRIPSKRWAKIGMAAGTATLIGLLFVYWPQIQSIWQRTSQSEDTAGRAVARMQIAHAGDVDLSELLHDKAAGAKVRISGAITQALADRIEEWRKAQPGPIPFKTEAYSTLIERGLDAEDDDRPAPGPPTKP
jgi:DNA-binding transcriptional LysR family regulator